MLGSELHCGPADGRMVAIPDPASSLSGIALLNARSNDERLAGASRLPEVTGRLKRKQDRRGPPVDGSSEKREKLLRIAQNLGGPKAFRDTVGALSGGETICFISDAPVARSPAPRLLPAQEARDRVSFRETTSTVPPAASSFGLPEGPLRCHSL